jgi:hypothetical protein
LRNDEGLAATLFVWPLIGNVLFSPANDEHCNEAISQAGIRRRVRQL